MMVLPISAILGIVVTRLIIDNYGEASYAQYMLLVGIVSLIPFADLGISAAIMNAVAEAKDPRTDANLRGTLITSMRILAGSATTLAVIAAILTLTGSWSTLLGEGLDGQTGELAAGLCIMALALAMLIGFGQRILIGLHLNFVAILVGGLQTPMVLLTLLGAIAIGVDIGPFVAVISYAGLTVTGAIMLFLANRRIRPILGEAFRDAWRVFSVRGGRVFDTAWPMLIQMVALPLAMQSNRLILSHTSGVTELSTYSLASQMFNPIFSVSVAASMALWPVFARARKTGISEVSPVKLSLIFASFALVAVTAMSFASPLLAQLASGGVIQLPIALVIAFAVLMVAQAAKSPLGMYMTDARGLRFQAYMALAMLPVNVGLSVLLAIQWGAVGPVIGSIIGVLLFQLFANWIYVRRDQRRRAASEDVVGTSTLV
ncbi:lipopolysaccharide biosynthesis protein [Microbacterium sp. P01]|uniref:lipopolysaccharide biosynthesis protein n=1 Tax=unclassified Microbacterium TaxID=2609290 RepID=UPI003671631C